MMADSTGLAMDRSFRILEMFRVERRGLRAAEIQRKIDCPKSSLNIILKGLVSLGYLNHDPVERSYFPSVRLRQLGDWILGALARGSPVQRAAAELRDRIDDTVVVSAKAELALEVALVEASNRPIALQLLIGTRLSLWSTAVGCAHLMSLSDRAIKQLHDIAGKQGRAPPELDDVMNRVMKARSVGYAVSFGSVIPDLAAIACPLLNQDGPVALVLSVGGPIQRVKQNWEFTASQLCRTARSLRQVGHI